MGLENWDTSITILEEKLAFAGKLYCYFHTHVNAGLKLPPKLKDREGLEWARVTTEGGSKKAEVGQHHLARCTNIGPAPLSPPPHTFLHLVFSFFHLASTLFVSSFLQVFHLNENLMITAVTRSCPKATSTHYRYADPGLNCGQVQCNPWPHVETVEIVETTPHHWSAPRKSGAGLVGWSEGG